MKKKKGLILTIVGISLLLIGIIVYYIFTSRDKNTTLTIMDKQWIESNKNKLVDMEITADVPNFNYNGEGVFFDFLKDFEKNIGIEFNRVALKENSEGVYSFRIVDNASNNDIFIYQDNYVMASKVNVKLKSLDEIEDVTLGVLESDKENAEKHLQKARNVTFKTYKNNVDLIKSIADDGIDAIIILKNYNLDDIVKNNLFINYNISDYTKDYVLTLGKTEKLNSIIKKYYKKWKNDNYEKSYNEAFANSYYLFNGIAERERVAFVSKRYSYGFVEEAPYNLLIDDRLNGINASLLRNFAKIAGIEIGFEEFDSREALLNRFNNGKLDFIFNDFKSDSYDIDTFDTESIFDEKVVYISSINNNNTINSIFSLKPYTVKVVKGTKIAQYLADNEINIKEYSNIDDLLSSMNNNSIAAINKETYNYYMRSLLDKYKVDGEERIPYDYYFVINYNSENEVFEDFFNYYLISLNDKVVINGSFNKLIVTKSRRSLILKITIYILATIGLITLIRKLLDLLLIRRRRKNTLTKEHKLKYVDMLTSLKNRNYLNDNIEKWDSSEVYPQTIIVIDLNNVAYINDNYGHQEGDNLIKEAANILIKTQISNTEIIRTNGNEFVVYMVGYDEKQVISYIKKLNREFKELAHGFGAAIGYSVINDAIKTIDDAVNEATLDMRNNKEEIQN